MNILVLIKEVPDMEKVRFDSDSGRVDRSSAAAELNPFDENALQAALDIKDGRDDIVVTALTMGPLGAAKSLKDAYARGADQGVLLTDRNFGGADTYATAETLAAAIVKLGGYDLILCGEKSVDGDTAQVGAEVAEVLNLPHAYYVEEILQLTENKVQVVIENLCGQKQYRTMELPALLSVTKNISRPKLPVLDRKLESLEIELQTLSLRDLDISEAEVGLRGSPTKVSKIVIPEEAKKEGSLYRGDSKEFIIVVSEELSNRGIIAR